MNEPIPPFGNPEKNAPASSTAPQPSENGGCLSLAGGAIGGFLLFVFLGAFVLSVANRGPLAVVYCVGSFIAAIALATKPGWRGVAIGIFLGLGVGLLIMAICSGFHIG